MSSALFLGSALPKTQNPKLKTQNSKLKSLLPRFEEPFELPDSGRMAHFA